MKKMKFGQNLEENEQAIETGGQIMKEIEQAIRTGGQRRYIV